MSLLFKDFVTEHSIAIKAEMKWENYTLNDNIIPAVDLIKDHSLAILSRSYGLFTVEQDILDPLLNDVFIYFPTLLQQLSISRNLNVMDVKPDDESTDTFTRTETMSSAVEQNSELNVGTTQTGTNVLNTQQKTAGTVAVANESEQTQTANTSIINATDIEKTGSHSVNLSHEMPEQAISGGTGNFPVDDQGTPNLSAAYVQNATQAFNTSNPVGTTETSTQNSSGTNNSTTDSTTTNDVTLSNTGTNTNTTVNSGKDNSEILTNTDSSSTIEETRIIKEANKQYAYEISEFLKSQDAIVAFKSWENRFLWVVGII